MRLLVAFALLLLTPLGAFAQTARPVPYPVLPPAEFAAAVAAGTRTPTGAPGTAYWTNRADYTIRATLAPTTATLRGTETIRYHNNSPDALDRLYVHLDQNIYREGAVRNRPAQVTGGVQVAEVLVDGTPLVEGVNYRIDGTLLRIDLETPVAAGTTVELDFAWSFRIPEAPNFRMGQDGEVFFLAYWYPRMAVYDDVDGWVAEPYQGDGEFYADYGSFDVAVTVPADMLVSATGTLQNADAVLAAETHARLARAAETRDVVAIVAEDERGGQALAPSATGTHTWRFHAEDVRDFAFGASAAYVWDATSAVAGDTDGDGTDEVALIHALYRPEEAAWHRAATFGQFSIDFLSSSILPYPYPQMSVVEGIIGGGMEFPMITLIGGAGRSEASLFGTTLHEIGHMWFPMVVGTNEKRYAWIDEGLTSFNTADGTAAFFGTESWNPARQSYYRIAGTSREMPSMRHADDYPFGSPARGIASYNKPAVAFHALRGLLGEATFEEAYRTFAAEWAYKHPLPYDLFNTFERIAGRDLDWFWRSLFFETWTLDHAVGGVQSSTDGAVVTVEDRGLTPMPAVVRVTYADGRTATETVPVETWLGGARRAEVRFAGGTVTHVELDPDAVFPDVDRANNTWTR